MYKSKRSKATDIPKNVKLSVFERDGGRCIICGHRGNPNAHYIPRSDMGLGIEQNVVTLCEFCHHTYDNGSMRDEYGRLIRDYLKLQYPNWNEENLRYNKYDWVKK